MTPQELRAHKIADKNLREAPRFEKCKKGKLPKPFKAMGGLRMHTTGLLKVSNTHSAIFFWRDGEILTDTAFIGHLMCHLNNGDLSPIFEFHWHPSHKGFHCKVPCKTQLNYANRMLPGAPELNMKTKSLDPRNETDRLALIGEFCEACGIRLGDSGQLF